MILRLFYLKILFLINISLIFCSVVYDRCGYEKEDKWAFTKTKEGAENGWSITLGYYSIINSWTTHKDANGNIFYIYVPDFEKRYVFNNCELEPYYIECKNDNHELTVQKTVEWTKGCVIEIDFQNNHKSVLFEKKEGESCSEGYIEYEWNNNEWIKIQCATDDECNGNDPNKCDKNNLEFIIIIFFFYF